jgi:sulfatase maturation enzyme AslB (radical SAM superfamily)
MNNSQNLPNDRTPLEETIATAPHNATVFSDGSTFDYENGYQNNGAPVATRERTENPTIVKSHRVVTANRVIGFAFGLFVLAIITGAILFGVASIQSVENWNALKVGINNSGQVEVVQKVDGRVLVKRPDGSLFNCDVSVVSNNGNPTGFVFCSPGGPATFSIPLPHDPRNVFYTAMTKASAK